MHAALETATVPPPPPLWRHLRRSSAPVAALLEHFRVLRPAVPVLDIARGLGAVILRAANPGWSGAVQVGRDGRVELWLDSAGTEARQRFTLAHLLGHLLLHEPAAHARGCSSFRGSRQEAEANRFAMLLLMPRHLLDEESRAVGGDVEQLAQRFGVSKVIMAARLSRLDVR